MRLGITDRAIQMRRASGQLRPCHLAKGERYANTISTDQFSWTG
jgi:hypothetical protein